MASYQIYDIQLTDQFTGKNLTASGGKVYVTTQAAAATTKKVALYNPDSDFAALTNPLTIGNGGRIRFALVSTATFGIAGVPPTVDLFGMSANGCAFQRRIAQPGVHSIPLDTSRADQVLMVPFHIDDTTATTETDTGFDSTTGMVIDPLGCFVHVLAADATETIEVGLLSSESGGDADGFLDVLSVGTAGVIAPTLAATAETLGALLRVAATADAGTGLVPRQHVINATAVSLTYTLTAGTDTAAGIIGIRYSRPIVPLI